MRNTIVAVVGVLLAIYLTMQLSTMYKAKGDLAGRVDYRLDFVDEQSKESVKRDLVEDARKFGIELRPANIDIVYADTEQQTVAEKMVGSRLGAQFKNKQVGISARYEVRILGVPISQTVTASKLKQVAAPVLPPRKEVQDLLDSQP